jgi:c-di-GMP-binding flagellar brake protein YcgR
VIETDKTPSVQDPVLVEAEVDGRVVGFRAVVVNVIPTALWLGLKKPDSRLESMRPGDPVHLTFKREGAALIGATTFLSHLGSTQSRLFSLDWPEGYQIVQRRAHLRLDTQVHLDYVVVSQSETSSAGTVGHGVTCNLSAGGVQFVVDIPVQDAVGAGDALELRLQFGQDVVLAEAEVVRVEDGTDAGPDGHPLPPARTPRPPRAMIAVRFESISDGAQDRIVRHIFSVQRLRK